MNHAETLVARGKRGDIELALKQLQSVREKMNGHHERSPGWFESAFGDALLAAERYADAAAAYENARVKEPQQAFPLLGRARVEVMLSQDGKQSLNAALASLEHAEKLKASDPCIEGFMAAVLQEIQSAQPAGVMEGVAARVEEGRRKACVLFPPAL